jgi:DNA polymerase
VFGVGAAAPEGQVPQVDWLIVGEAPGEHEDLQGEPFVGQAGKLLDNMLKACGLSRHGERGPQGGGVYIANVLKCRPPGNRNPQPEEVAQCEPYLQRQVQLLQPKIIVAMGRFAVQSLLADSVPEVASHPLGKLRGKVYQYHGVPVVVTYHPAYLLRSLNEKAKAWADLCLAMAQRRA